MRRAPVALVLSLAACGSKPPAPPPPPPIPLHVQPACDLAPAAGADWLVEAKPRDIAAVPDLIPAIGLVLPEARLQLFATSHGGVDLRQVKDLCIAQYKDAQLQIADVLLDPERVASAFATRTKDPPQRTILARNPKVQSLSGEVGDESQQVTTFGIDAVALARGKPWVLRAAEGFAFGQLKRAVPVLKGSAFLRASDVLGDAPLRVFARGPFHEEVARGVGGILRATLAVGASASYGGTGTQIDVKIVLVGGWGADAPAVAERLAAAANVLADSDLGRLFGLNQPIRSPRAHGEADAVVLEATLDGDLLAKGLRDALDADVAEIMRR